MSLILLFALSASSSTSWRHSPGEWSPSALELLSRFFRGDRIDRKVSLQSVREKLDEVRMVQHLTRIWENVRLLASRHFDLKKGAAVLI